MNNEIKENNNNNLQVNNENQNNIPFYKINIIKSCEKVVVPQTPVNNTKKNLLLSPKRRKSRNEDELNKILLDCSFRSKKIPILNPTKKDNPPDSPNLQNLAQKSKILNEKDKNSPNRNNYSNKNKEILNQDVSISSRSRISINFNNNINNSNSKNNNNESSYLNILKYTKKIYENDEHLNKQMLTKKIDINDLSKLKKNDLFTSGKMGNKNFQKKKLIISFGLNENENENPHILQGNYNKNIKSFKRKISSGTKGRPSNELSKSKEKSSFSNFIKLKEKIVNRVKGNESSKNFYINNNNDNNLMEDNNSIKLYKLNKDVDLTSKSSKFYLSTKNIKAKNMNTGKILEEKSEKNDKNKNKVRNNPKINKTKNQKKESISSNKNQTNDFDIIKKETTKNKENKIENNLENNTNKKKKKICFFCCLNSKENDSDEI